MEFNQIAIPCTRHVDQWFTLYGLGDIHEGSASGYGERANYPPTEIGTPKIQFNPVIGDIRVVV